MLKVRSIAVLFAVAIMMLWVNVGMGQTEWEKHSDNPVFGQGSGGTWDYYYVYRPTVIFDGSEYKMWYTGFNRTYARIGLATSTDGINWTRYPGNPVLSVGSGGSWDDYHVAEPWVIYDGVQYKMWYSGYDGSHRRIGYATSSDGITWQKHPSNPVLNLGASGTWEHDDVAFPSVVFDGSQYRMWYIGQDVRNGTNRIGLATSVDGVVWRKYAGNPVLNLGAGGIWDSLAVDYPSVLLDGAVYKMWYTGSGGDGTRIGYATSTDGIVWQKHQDNPVLDLGPSGAWDDKYLWGGCAVLSDGTQYKMWYSGQGHASNSKIGYATSKPPMTIDMTQPSSNITVTQGQKVDIAWTGSGGSYVSLRRDNDKVWDNGGSGEEWITLNRSVSGSYSWYTTGVPAGTYYVAGMITDGTQSTHDYAAGTVKVNLPMTIDLTQPSSNITVTQGQKVDIAWTGSGPSGSNVSLRRDNDKVWDNGGSGEEWITLNRSVSGSYSWYTTGVPAGTYYIAGMITDGAQSTHDYAVGTVKVTLPMTIDLAQPSGDVIVTQGKKVNISWTGSGPTGSYVSLRRDNDKVWDNGGDGEVWIAINQDVSGDYSWNTMGVPVGDHYLAVMITDGTEQIHRYALGKITIEPAPFWVSEFNNSVVYHTPYVDEETSKTAEFIATEAVDVGISAFLRFGLHLLEKIVIPIHAFLVFVNEWTMLEHGTILESYAASELSSEFQDELHVSVGDEILPMLMYNTGDEADWVFGFDLVIEKKEGWRKWTPIRTVRLMTGEEAMSVKWGWNNCIVAKDPIPITDPGVYRLTGGCKIVAVVPDRNFSVQAYSPVDLIVRDPRGRTISKSSSAIPSASYEEEDLNNDGELDDRVIIPDALVGDYSIEAVPEPDVKPTDTYTLDISHNGKSTRLAENLQIQDIPTQPYSFSVPDESVKKIISITSAEAPPGTQTTVQIDIDDAAGVASADMFVEYDASVIAVDDVEGTDLVSGMTFVVNKDVPGKIKIFVAGAQEIPSGSGALVNIRLTTNAEAQTGTKTTLRFDDAELYDESGQVIPVDLQNGVLEITGVRGDVSKDGKLRSNDATLALRIAAELMTPTDYQKWAADMNGDGKIRSNDATLILRKAAGLAAPGRGLIAEPGQPVAVTLPRIHGVAGESITVPIRFDNVDMLGSGDICLSYNSAVLRAVDISSDPGLLLAGNVSEPGIVRIAFADPGQLSNGTLAEIEFNILADDISPLKLSIVELYGSDAALLKSRGIDGEFRSWAVPPDHNALMQNFPNPFNPDTWIPYQLREGSEVTIRIYSVGGDLVREMKLGYKPAGLYLGPDRAAHWDGRNASGETIASGIYFFTIQAGDYKATRKMTVAR